MRVTSLLFLALLLVSPPSASALTIVTEESPPSTVVHGGSLTGSSVQIVTEIQKRAGDHSKIEVFPWARAYSMAVTEPDVVIFATSRTPDRESLFEWVGPIMRLNWAFFAPAGKMRPLASLEDAKAVGAIGTYRNDAREAFLRERGFTNLESTSDPVANVRKLLAGRIDLIASTDVGIRYGHERANIGPGVLENVLTFWQADLYIAFSKGSDPAVVSAWRKALADMKADGTFAAIYSKWLPGETAPK